MDTLQKTGDKKTKAVKIEKSNLLQEIQTALNDLENFMSKDCAHKIEALLEYQLSTQTAASLEKIRELLKLYEDDAAEQMLRELIEQLQKED